MANSQRVEEEILVKNSSACKDYLIEAMKYHLLPLEQRALMKSTRTKLRTPSCLPKVSMSLICTSFSNCLALYEKNVCDLSQGLFFILKYVYNSNNWNKVEHYLVKLIK